MVLMISVITATYNRENTIGDAIRSLQSQTYRHVEHVVVDGASSDGTLAAIQCQADDRCRVISEPDQGIYDAINKGIAASTGDIIGLLHSDDYFADENALAAVAEKFEDDQCDIVYGDLEYVSNDTSRRTIRLWKAGEFDRQLLRRGWMPPHPTVFLSRRAVEKHGVYDTSYRIAADYEAMIRYFGDSSLKLGYLPIVITKMRIGGESNKSIANLVCKMSEDYRSIKRHEIGGFYTLLSKNFSKIMQFV